MNWYYTQIRWIDPNGYGVISEYHYQGINVEGVEKKSLAKFQAHAKKLYGDTWHKDVEVRSMDSDKIVAGLHNQRKWGNLK